MIDRRSLIRITSAIAGAIGLPFGRAGAEVKPAPAKVSPRARDMTDEIQEAIDDAHRMAMLPCVVYAPDGSYRVITRPEQWGAIIPKHCVLDLSRFSPGRAPALITRPLRIPSEISIVGPVVLDARQIVGPCIEVCGPEVSIGSMSILLGPQSTHAIETNGWDTFIASIDEHVVDA